jgi:hypothetical protein
MSRRFTTLMLGFAASLAVTGLPSGAAGGEPTRTATGPKLGEESKPEGEDRFVEKLRQLQLEAMKPNPALRGQHPKQHGCVLAEFTVSEGLPESLRHGIFSQPRTYRALIRFSNGAASDDRDRDVHGMAIKLIGVGATREGGAQDFVLMDHPVFFAENVENLVELFLAIGASRREPPDNEPLRKFAAAHPTEFKHSKDARSKLPSTPLQIQYWSTVPYRLGLGQGGVKYTAKPREEAADGQQSPGGSKDYLREAMVQRLSGGNKPVIYDFCVQRQTDPTKEPIENPTVRWTTPEEPVATIVIRPQMFDSDELQQFGANLVFDPWNSLAEHQPLGGINRARKPIYPASSELRHKTRQDQGKEPSGQGEPTEADLARFQRALRSD